jgi:hypothetical protein
MSATSTPASWPTALPSTPHQQTLERQTAMLTALAAAAAG